MLSLQIKIKPVQMATTKTFVIVTRTVLKLYKTIIIYWNTLVKTQ
jgi:hypothetical protein